MRKFHHILAGTVGILGLTVGGCSKSESPAPAPVAAPSAASTPAPAPATSTPAPTTPTATAPAPATPPPDPVAALANKAKDATAAAQASAQQTVQETAQRVQTIIDATKQLIADKKYQDALGALSKLNGLQLTAEQQKMVDDLKAQAQKLVSGDAAKTIGGLLEGKKP